MKISFKFLSKVITSYQYKYVWSVQFQAKFHLKTRPFHLSHSKMGWASLPFLFSSSAINFYGRNKRHWEWHNIHIISHEMIWWPPPSGSPNWEFHPIPFQTAIPIRFVHIGLDYYCACAHYWWRSGWKWNADVDFKEKNKCFLSFSSGNFIVSIILSWKKRRRRKKCAENCDREPASGIGCYIFHFYMFALEGKKRGF